MSQAKVIKLKRPGLVVEPPTSRRIKSRVVELAPGQAVGEHLTHRREELVVVLEGSGRLRLPDTGEALPLERDRAAFVPPETLHDILNTGEGPLRYIYVVALLD